MCSWNREGNHSPLLSVWGKVQFRSLRSTIPNSQMRILLSHLTLQETSECWWLWKFRWGGQTKYPFLFIYLFTFDIRGPYSTLKMSIPYCLSDTKNISYVHLKFKIQLDILSFYFHNSFCQNHCLYIYIST
jgi:hypothetical protein